MVRKMILSLCGLCLSLQGLAALEQKKLTQEQYDQRIQFYTNQVNATKHLLDDDVGKIEATEQHQVFCTRVDAYQGIASLSQANIELETAHMMLVIANNFLDRQKQSMEQSGMTLDVFCKKSLTK